jgi:hypothetical protein
MRPFVAAVSCLLVMTGGWPGVDATSGRTLAVQLGTAATLPAPVRETLMREAARIWRHHGVTLEWTAAGAQVPAHEPRLRVLVVERALSTADGVWPVGELVRLADQSAAPGVRTALAVLSVAAARDVVTAAHVGSEPNARTRSRLGLVLGRALAHEVGHFLLDTSTHAARGLMRARIDAAEFADLRDGSFLLDRAAARWVHGGAQVASAAFSYSTP